jgi:uncharacterized protein YlxP (DUF503 family)
MTIGLLRLAVFIHGSNSLKERRMRLNSLKAKLRNNFNVAVAQVDTEDKWQRATLAVVTVGKDRGNLNSGLSMVLNFVERFHDISLLNHEMELI